MDGVPGHERAVGPSEDVLGMGRRTCIVGVYFSCSALRSNQQCVYLVLLFHLFHVVRLYSERAFTATIQSGQQEFFENSLSDGNGAGAGGASDRKRKGCFFLCLFSHQAPVSPF